MTLQTLTGALPLPLADGEDEDMWDGLGKVCIYYISLSSWTSAIIKYIYIYIHILSLVLFSQDLLSNSCPTVITAGTLVRSDPPKVPVLISSHCAAGFLAR